MRGTQENQGREAAPSKGMSANHTNHTNHTNRPRSFVWFVWFVDNFLRPETNRAPTHAGKGVPPPSVPSVFSVVPLSGPRP